MAPCAARAALGEASDFGASRGFLLIALLISAGTQAHAQTANCDFASGLVDLFINVRFEDFVDCPQGSGLPCTQSAAEKDLVGWGVVLASGPGTAGDSGVTNGSGDSAWTGNGGLTNTCVNHGGHQVTLSLPVPSPYDPEASWPTNLTFTFTINPTEPVTGNAVERYFLTIYLACACQNDQDACTLDTCANGLCAYGAAPFDPSRAEICNSKDDDCDGDIDEGLPPTSPECTQAPAIGCADKTREGFMDWPDFPLIAACGGAWSQPGVDGAASCSRAAGNHGGVANGSGCSAADLCPVGWHLCYGREDVAQRLGNGDCSDVLDPHYPNFGSAAPAAEVSVPPGGAFFASAARSDGGGACEEGVNDGAGPASQGAIFGCGNMGLASDACGFFDREAGQLCGGVRDVEPTASDDPATDFGYQTSPEWAWSCGAAVGGELGALRKTLPDRQGGVLCCKDTDPSLSEVCDGVDNDSDGATDETDFGGGGVIEVGDVCPSGGQCGDLVCTPAGGWDCIDLRACADTSCDGVDDDGDGATDEEYVGAATNCGLGACAASGVMVCVDGAESDGCTPGPESEASDVTCDGQDGDCDGSADEDFVAATSSCGVGACAASGTLSCVRGVPLDSCVPGEKLADDDANCDAIDDDCDGESDEDVAESDTSCGVGACVRAGVIACQGGDMVDVCTPGAPLLDDATCDGLDGDCDGETDEDFVARATSCGVGACAGNGEAACVNGSESDTCDPLEGATAETCNGADDDCDGQTDEGLSDGSCADRDEDSVPDVRDNCVDIPNTDQADSDDDGTGDACDVVAQGGACQGGQVLGGWMLALAGALGWVLVRLGRKRQASVAASVPQTRAPSASGR